MQMTFAHPTFLMCCVACKQRSPSVIIIQLIVLLWLAHLGLLCRCVCDMCVCVCVGLGWLTTSSPLQCHSYHPVPAAPGDDEDRSQPADRLSRFVANRCSDGWTQTAIWACRDVQLTRWGGDHSREQKYSRPHTSLWIVPTFYAVAGRRRSSHESCSSFVTPDEFKYPNAVRHSTLRAFTYVKEKPVYIYIYIYIVCQQHSRASSESPGSTYVCGGKLLAWLTHGKRTQFTHR